MVVELCVAALAVFVLTWLGTGVVLRLLRHWAILDRPNQRSSHTLPTPRGGSLALVPVAAVAWLGVAALGWAPAAMAMAAGWALGLAVVFWRDDLGGLPIGVRIAAQVMAVTAMLVAAPADTRYFGGLLPAWLDALAAGFLWVYFINLFNFMDGIDGITGVETACVGLGAAAVAAIAGLGESLPLAGVTLAAAALGFLVWNWHPAKIFLGDVGSVPLGFLLGWLLLELAAAGQPLPALILPAYYLLDASVTLGRRIVRGDKFWRAHREHFYQRAVARGLSHASVSAHILAVGVMLAGLAVAAAAGYETPALLGALLVLFALLGVLAGPRRTA